MNHEHDETTAFNTNHDKEVLERVKAGMRGIFDLPNLTVFAVNELPDGYEAIVRTGQGYDFYEGVVTFREVPRCFRDPKLKVVS